MQPKIKEHEKNQWSALWKRYQERQPCPTPAQQEELGTWRLKLHEILRRAEISLATQIRSEQIGLADFLHRKKVPGITTSSCLCGNGPQTAKHVIIYCHMIDRESLKQDPAVSSLNYRLIVGTPSSLRLVTRWLMRQGLLTQFSLALEML